MTEDQQPAAVDALIDGLRTGSARAEPGVFSLDSTAALRKMQDYRLADPHHYVLELVQAATHKGATWIDVQLDSDDLWMRFDGEPYSAAQLSDIYPAVFRADLGSANRALAQLGLALNAARALELRWARVVSGPPGERVALQVVPGQDDEVAEGADEPGRPPGRGRVATEIHVKMAPRTATVGRLVEGLAEKLPEARALRERCANAALELTVNGERVSRGLDLPGAVGVTPFDAPGLRGVAGLRPEGEPARVRLAMHGVELNAHELPGGDLGFEALVEADGLRKDVSQSDVVQNDRYNEVMAAVRRVHADLARNEDAQRALGVARRDMARASLEQFYPPIAARYQVSRRLPLPSMIGIGVAVAAEIASITQIGSWRMAPSAAVMFGILCALCVVALIVSKGQISRCENIAIREIQSRFPPASALRFHALRLIKSRRQGWPLALAHRLQQRRALN